MSGASLLALLDDIAAVLDDVALMTKVAAEKTAGVLGDDLALNAEQVSGVRAERELPVVWAVAVGSLKNKMILVPLALLLSALAPWSISPLLMVGGAYLCFEGFEKLAHKYMHTEAEDEAHLRELVYVVEHENVDMVQFEKEKIKGAIRTDFVLSGEIIIITLGIVANYSFATRLAVLAGVGLIMTIGVYGLVALIVKLDDIGFYLQRHQGQTFLRRMQRRLGDGFVSFAPRLMRSLTVIGTVAMFLVGGGILVHGLPMMTALAHSIATLAGHVMWVGGVLEVIVPSLMDMLFGVIAGAFVLVGVVGFNRIFRRSKR
jgi:predicted DNA repair protein MutK